MTSWLRVSLYKKLLALIRNEDLVAWQLVGNRSMWTSKQAWFGTTKWFCDLPSVHTLLRQVPWTKAKRLLNLSSKHVSSKLSQTTRSTHLFLPSKQWSNTLPVALPASMKRKTSSKWDVTLERSFFWWKRPGKIWMKFLMRTPSPNIYYTRKTVKHANNVLCDGGKSQKLPLPKENKGSHWSANSDGCRWGFAQNFWYLIRLSGRNCIQSQKKLHPKEEHFFWKLKLPYQHCIPHKLHRSPVQVTSVRGESLRAICKVFSGKALLGGHSWAETWSEFRTLPEKLGKRMIKKCPFMKISYSMEIHWWKSQWNPMNLFSATGGLGGICEHITCAVRKNH